MLKYFNRDARTKREEYIKMEDKCRILIVDDEYILRQGIRFMMNWEEEGFEIAGEASNGKEALDMMEEVKPHIILCDIAMPVMDGLDFIKIVSRKYPRTQILVLSSYDKFDYVRQALLNGAADYVLKPTLNPEKLLSLVTSLAQKIPNFKLKRQEHATLNKTLENYLKEKEVLLPAPELQNFFIHSCFRLFVLPLYNREWEQMHISSVLYEKAEFYLKQMDYCKILYFLQNQETLCVVVNYGLKDEKRVLTDLEQLMEQLAQISERAFGKLGYCYRKLADLRQDFLDTSFWDAEIFYHKYVHLYQYQKEERSDMERFDFRKFTEYITDSRYQEAIDLFDSYITRAAKEQMSEEKLKNQTKNLLYNLIGNVQDRVQDLENLRKQYFDKIEKTVYIDEFMDVFQEMIEKIRYMMGTSGSSKDDYLEQILEYIQKHYKEELDLQSVANAFNFSYSYLSVYFNTHMGEGFNEYLNRIRIKKACELLTNHTYSIAQVSDLVGYSDHSYFCRVFKKITGKTPSKYRREKR